MPRSRRICAPIPTSRHAASAAGRSRAPPPAHRASADGCRDHRIAQQQEHTALVARRSAPARGQCSRCRIQEGRRAAARDGCGPARARRCRDRRIPALHAAAARTGSHRRWRWPDPIGRRGLKGSHAAHQLVASLAVLDQIGDRDDQSWCSRPNARRSGRRLTEPSSLTSSASTPTVSSPPGGRGRPRPRYGRSGSARRHRGPPAGRRARAGRSPRHRYCRWPARGWCWFAPRPRCRW